MYFKAMKCEVRNPIHVSDPVKALYIRRGTTGKQQSDLSYQHKSETQEMWEKKCNLLALFM